MRKVAKIRVAGIADCEHVMRLLSECRLPTEGVRENIEQGYCVADSNGAVVGVAGVEVYGCNGLLRSVAVAPAFRGMKLGRALVRNRIAWAKSKGLSELYLLTTTAATFFHRLGFAAPERSAVPADVKESSEFAVLCPETAVAMARSFGRSPLGCAN